MELSQEYGLGITEEDIYLGELHFCCGVSIILVAREGIYSIRGVARGRGRGFITREEGNGYSKSSI